MSGYYEVYLARYTLAMHDPDIPGPRFHTSVFVKTDADGGGTLHHLTGDIASVHGMRYNPQKKRFPMLSENFYSLEKIGVTPVSKHPTDWEAVLRSILAPPQQKAFNTDTRRMEPFKTRDPLTFYEPDEAQRPLMKCTEWTLEWALPALRANGLIIEQ